jgi:hypothetical protein
MKMLRHLLSIGLLLSLFASAASADPLLVSIDPGAVGTGFSYQNFDFFDLAGTGLNGQMLSLDVVFTDSKFLVDKAVDIELFLNQSGNLGTLPAGGYAVSGYLLNGSGDPLGSSVSFLKNVEMPAQIWPGWPYTLGGQPFLPATVGFEFKPSGTIVDNIPGPDYSISPLVFYGIHFDIQLPNSPGNTLLGSRLQLANFDSPILISPDPIPEYIVHVPEPGSLVLLGAGLVGILAIRGKRLSFSHGSSAE